MGCNCETFKTYTITADGITLTASPWESLEITGYKLADSTFRGEAVYLTYPEITALIPVLQQIVDDHAKKR